MKKVIKINDKPYVSTARDETYLGFTLDKVYNDVIGEIEEKAVEDEYYSIEITRAKGKKTLSQNGECWRLLHLLAENNKPKIKPEDVYKKLVSDNNLHNFDITVSKKDEKRFKAWWNSRGTTWFCHEIKSNDKFVALKCFYGMSTYSKSELSEFIEIVKNECNKRHIGTEVM